LGHLNFGDSNLPFGLAQGGELVEPFRISANFIRSGEFPISGLSGLGWTLLSLFFYPNVERNHLNEVDKQQKTLSVHCDYGYGLVFSSGPGRRQTTFGK
jgi:hypothetical protein